MDLQGCYGVIARSLGSGRFAVGAPGAADVVADEGGEFGSGERPLRIL